MEFWVFDIFQSKLSLTLLQKSKNCLRNARIFHKSQRPAYKSDIKSFSDCKDYENCGWNVAKIAKAPMILTNTADFFKQILEVLKSLPKKLDEDGRKEIVGLLKKYTD